MTSIDFTALVKEQNYPDWIHTPQNVKDIAKELAQDQVQLFDNIAKQIDNPTIDNVMKPFAKFSNENSFLENQITFYQHVSDNKELRDASTEAEELLDKTSIEQWSRLDVFQVFEKLNESVKNDALVDPETKRYLTKILISFKRNGLALPSDQREIVKKLQVELSNLKLQFAKNLGEDKGYILFSEDELEGIPKDVISQYEKIEEDGKTKLKVTFKYPDILPVFRHASNSNTRKLANLAYGNRVSENDEILDKIIRIRYDIAKELGYDTFSDYVLEERMAKRKETVLDFLDDLRTKLDPVAENDLKELKKLKKQDFVNRGLKEEDDFYAWDFNYYNEKLLEDKYQVDNTKVAEYFPLQSTIDKMLQFYEKIFDIKFVKLTPPKNQIWHEDVQQYSIFQGVTSGKLEHIGAIYFDLHPREGKYGHAANFGLGPGFEESNGDRHTPVTALVCNFTKPTKEKPSLLKHNEVVTFFHELGHGIHNILSQTKYARFHGTSVERDFVETPSQMLEYWCWSKNEIKALSSHYETGEPMNDELISQLVKTKHINTGLFNLRQLFFGIFDMKLHTINSREQLDKLDLLKTWNELKDSVTLLPSDDNPTKGYASFGHIAGGYESGYYGYLYSLVFAADIYHTLFKEDPMNTENGIRYRDIILKRGGSREIMDNLEELLGRKPNSDAFLKETFG
ncbi:PRD1 [Candida pseudojiufengensis]|uniref:PRD1 n=1 Tax=Candida pseudojiufengensis TaxID=497109 RepID=UPI0022250F9A|nr:PRD1 [Candida pseudojiufengensis]KAI5966297.1 PRD1 [Candida pseudojiufengensis]